ncbi:hypothetical protein ZIOFF_052800 [Zingiber officinale]|uniref:ATPase F1/V1/A1 complex alpha/beta subunit N-terminal domain-containing protein n=1 Tax=Zingiber officinale TaxID=94328 RepID=A0A8J5KSR8_ZINOF|nr:hypothetical protein ZIOFF_052800 [Zingiber officinale]
MVTLRADEISNIIRERIEQYTREVKIVNTGTVLQVGDGIAHIHGLDEVMAGELVEFEEGTIGIALNLESNNVGVVLMGDGLMIQEGSSVKATGRIAQIHVSEGYLGRVINALAKPIDGRDVRASRTRAPPFPTSPPEEVEQSVGWNQLGACRKPKTKSFRRKISKVGTLERPVLLFLRSFYASIAYMYFAEVEVEGSVREEGGTISQKTTKGFFNRE